MAKKLNGYQQLEALNPPLKVGYTISYYDYLRKKGQRVYASASSSTSGTLLYTVPQGFELYICSATVTVQSIAQVGLNHDGGLAFTEGNNTTITANSCIALASCGTAVGQNNNSSPTLTQPFILGEGSRVYVYASSTNVQVAVTFSGFLVSKSVF